MGSVEKIEYYLNKDHHKNLFFNGVIPPAWEFSNYHVDLKAVASTVVDKPGYNNYAYNNLSYRSNFDYTVESLSDKKCILCLGDSDTFGRSIQLENIWSTQIAKSFEEYTVMNMGLFGAGPDSVSRIGVNTIMALPTAVKIVLIAWPPYLRREVATKKSKAMVYKTPFNDEVLPFENYWDQIDWVANSYNFYKNKLFLEAVCKANNIEYYDLEINLDTPAIKEDFINEYRYFGNNTHKAIANYFEKKIKKEPSVFEQRSRSL